jgi:hypothetical protein
MAINWQADPNTSDTAWTNLLFVSSMFVKPQSAIKKTRNLVDPAVERG